MQDQTEVLYSYKLEPFSMNWSTWQKQPFREFNYLPPGNYTFQVKSKSIYGQPGSTVVYSFEIEPLWYQTSWAIGLMILGGLILFLVVIYRVKVTVEKFHHKSRLEEQKARKLLELELQQMKLRAEKERITRVKSMLEEDVIHKSKELANYTMLLVKKREVIIELRANLEAMEDLSRSEKARKQVREMIRSIDRHLADEEYLQVFEANFEKVHHDFFLKLKELYPDLNQRELRLCAFVKMNLTNKEISPLLNISVRGVETARYRLRKKFNLEFEHNLTEYLESIGTGPEKPQTFVGEGL
jgi:hypothetical protein